jgi:hypothetical protein
VLLSLYNDAPAGVSDSYFARFQNESVLDRVRALDRALKRNGAAPPGELDPPLIAIGTEFDGDSLVRNGYGPFSLAWQTPQHAVWTAAVTAEAERLHREFREANKVPLRFIFWVGGGCAVEDKHVYHAAGLLRRGPRSYVLDSTDPAKLTSVLGDIERRHGLGITAVLRSTVVAAVALEMDCPESLVNLERLAALYERYGVESARNFLILALPGSQLERFGRDRGYPVRPLAIDGANPACCRHSGPLTQGSLLSLALAKADLKSWISGAVLSDAEIRAAWQLGCFIQAQSEAGRDKLTLLLPKRWSGAELWTKREFENRLGRNENLGLKVVICEKGKLANYRSPKDPLQDRAFIAVQCKGEPGFDTRKIGLLRRSGYPLACAGFPHGTPLSSYMQFVHWTLFACAYLREVNFVTPCGTGLYSEYAGRIYAEACERGGIQKTAAWAAAMHSSRRRAFSDSVTLHYDRLCAHIEGEERLSAPQVYAAAIRSLVRDGALRYGEFTFYGDMRYSKQGAALRKLLQRAAEELFGARLKMPADVHEGPAANHAYHEAVIGRGKCFSTLLLSEKQAQLPAARYSADHHVAQFLATRLALAQRNRPVVAITLKDLTQPSLDSLGDFFRRAASALRTARI